MGLDKGFLATCGNRNILGLCFKGDGGAGAVVSVDGSFVSLDWLGVDSSPSASMVSSRASTPATALERNEPHPDDVCFAGAAIAGHLQAP